MSELLNNYAPHGVFLRDNYFIQSYNTIPSRLHLELQFEANKKNMDAVLEKLDIDSHNLEAVFKIWKTSRNKDAETVKDFPYAYFYKSNDKHLCIWVSLQHDNLFFEFLFDHQDTALEEWIVSYSRETRDAFGKNETPTLKVLSKSSGQFYTEEIDIKNFQREVNKLYNDDFMQVHEIIDEAIDVDSSGLILLHGPPGTGKTSYIKNLLSTHNKRDFIFIPNDFVNELLQPDFISFLIINKNSILVIEDAEKVITSRDNNTANSVVSTILQLTDGLFSDFLNIKIICTFNTSIDKVDKALLRKGRMIAFYEFKALSVEKTNELKRSLGHDEGEAEMTLAEIFNADKKDFVGQEKLSAIGFKSR